MFSRFIAFMCLLCFSASAAAAISYITSVSGQGNSDSASLVVPTSTVIDDVLLVQVAIRDRNGSDGVTAPSGWSQIGSQIDDGSVLQSSYYRVATAADAGSGISYEWDFDGNGSRRYILAMSVFRGVDTASPVDDENSQSGMVGSSVTAPSVTISATNAMLVGFYSLAAGNQSFTAASGMVEAYDIEENNNNSGLTAMAAYEQQASTGGSGDKVATASKNNDDAIGHLVALNEGTALPAVSSAGGSCGTDNLIVVQYASPANDEALNVSNYTLTNANITGITRQDDNTVVLATDGLVGGQTYTLTVQGNAHVVGFDGLMGRYYDQRNAGGSKVSYPGGLFTGSEFLRLDSQVNFSWNTATPTVFPNISGNDERFSIEWTGYIAPAIAGSYEFRMYSDDGARLNLEGVEIINDWSLHAPRYSTTSAPQALNVGQTYEVKMEHFEQTGRAYAQLEWRRDGGSWENIPTANLTTCSIPAVTPLPPSALEFRMDELSWDGTTGEVIDDSGNNDNATARGGLNTVDPGHLCRAGDFDGVDDYIESSQVYDLLKGTSSMSFWIKTTQTGDDTGWRAPGIAGIEQSGGSDDIFWGWLDASGHIGLSVANDFTTKSTIPINDDVYHHIVLTRDAVSGAYKIYIDGSLNQSGTVATGIIGNSFSSIGQIEDTGGTPEYFEGDLDEVKIFASVLTDTDVTTLFTETRVCAPISGCAASFPDGISSHENGEVNFGYQAQLFLSPDGVLDAGTVVRNGGAVTTLTCDFVDCSVSGSAVALLDPGNFPVFSSTQDITVSSGDTKVLGDEGSTDTYNNISVSGTLNVSGTYAEYFIKNMSLGYNGEFNLAAGDYWIETLSVNSSVKINVVGGGTARLFVKNAISVGSSTRINSPSNNVSGSPEELLIFGYSNVSFGSQSTTSAVVYAKGNISLGSPSYVFGALTGSDVSLNSNAQVSYDANAISTIDLGAACGGTSSCSLGSFVIAQPTYGLACPQARAKIDVQAMCADGVTVKDDYAGTIDLSSDENSQSEFYQFSGGGSVINSYTFTGAELGDVDLYLFHKNDNPELKVTADDNVAGISSEALTGTYFGTSGFAVTAPNNFVCGANSSVTLTAIGQDTTGGASCSQLTGFSGNKNLKAWSDINIDPTEAPSVKDSGLPVSVLIDGQPIAETVPASTNITLSFASGVSTFPVSYLDVGEVLNINVIHDDVPYDGSQPPLSSLAASSGLFVVSPGHVEVDADDSLSACTAPLANCTTLAKANAPFSITGQAVCSDASSTVAQSYRGTVGLTHQLVAPTSGVTGALDVTQLVFDGTGATAGKVNESNQKISEVGVFTLSTVPPNYFGETVAPSTSSNIGRFYPDQFNVGIVDSTFQPSCTSTDSFTYMDEPFLFLTAPVVTIEAINVDGVKTENYEGDFWKLGTDLSEDSGCTGAGTVTGFCYSDNVAGATTLLAPKADQGYGDISDVGGGVTLTLHNTMTDEFIYRRPTTGLVAPFDADVQLTIELSDSDSVQGNETLANMGFSGDFDVGGSNYNATDDKFLRYGRWKLENAFGPETNSLKVPMLAQFYDGTVFITNTDDNCSTYDAIDMVINPSLANSGSTSASGSGTAINGEALLAQQVVLSAPGLTHEGSAQLCLNVENWLKFDWNNDGLNLAQVCDASSSSIMGDNDNPMSTATFGRYRGHDRIIYWREVSN